MLVMSELNEEIEYWIGMWLIVRLGRFSDVKEGLKGKWSLELWGGWEWIRGV